MYVVGIYIKVDGMNDQRPTCRVKILIQLICNSWTIASELKWTKLDLNKHASYRTAEPNSNPPHPHGNHSETASQQLNHSCNSDSRFQIVCNSYLHVLLDLKVWILLQFTGQSEMLRKLWQKRITPTRWPLFDEYRHNDMEGFTWISSCIWAFNWLNFYILENTCSDPVGSIWLRKLFGAMISGAMTDSNNCLMNSLNRSAFASAGMNEGPLQTQFSENQARELGQKKAQCRPIATARSYWVVVLRLFVSVNLDRETH